MSKFKTINLVVDLVINTTVIVLSLRFLLRLFGANPVAPFVNWIYDVTTPLLSPFRGIFSTPKLEPGIYLELSTLFAIIVYLIVGYILEWAIITIKESLKKQ